jgi:hypothetical protein
MTNDNELAQWPFAACFLTRGHLENRAGRKHALQAPFRFYGNDGTKFPKNCATVWFDFNYCHRVRLFRDPESQSTFPPNAQRNAFRRRDARQQSSRQGINNPRSKSRAKSQKTEGLFHTRKFPTGTKCRDVEDNHDECKEIHPHR